MLLAIDLVQSHRKQRKSARLREYAFLAFCALVAIGYAELHDQITVRISPGYFVVAKGARPARLYSDVALLALKASYGPGLIAGALLLIVNNPSKRREQLSYAKLGRLVALPLIAAGLCAVAGGFVGRYAPPADFVELSSANFQPDYRQAFHVVAGIHWGSYVGLCAGTVAAVAVAWRSRAPKVEATIPT